MKDEILSDQKIEALEDAAEGVFTIDPYTLPDEEREENDRLTREFIEEDRKRRRQQSGE